MEKQQKKVWRITMTADIELPVDIHPDELNIAFCNIVENTYDDIEVAVLGDKDFHVREYPVSNIVEDVSEMYLDEEPPKKYASPPNEGTNGALKISIDDDEESIIIEECADLIEENRISVYDGVVYYYASDKMAVRRIH